MKSIQQTLLPFRLKEPNEKETNDWKAVRQIFPGVKEQRCRVHKTVNVLDKLPKSEQTQAKRMLQNIYMHGSRKDALRAFDRFVDVYSDKYSKAVECLVKDKEELLDALRLSGGSLAEHKDYFA